MRKIWQVVLVGSSLLLSGCESKQVQAYALQLEALVKSYQAGIAGRITAERQLYAQLAQRFAVEAERDVYEGLKIERQHQQRVLSAALLEKRMSAAQVYERMRDTALLELERSKGLLEEELQLEASYQAGLARVALDTKKIQALASALQVMRTEPGLGSAMAEVTEFGGAFQKAFALEECKGMAQELASLTEGVTLLQSEVQSEVVKKKVEALKAEQAALSARLAAQGRFSATAKKCQ